MGIRKGSIVTVVAAELGGPSSSNTSFTGATVVDITNGYVVIDTGSIQVLPWGSVRQLIVTTY